MPVDELTMKKSTTHKIVIFEPDESALKTALIGRELSGELTAFLMNLLKARKWARKINIPSGRNDVAAALVFTTSLKESGLEILSELHVFFAGSIIVEKWEVAGESQRKSLLPNEVFRAIEINKVRIDGSRVHIEFSVPLPGGGSITRIKTFDFAADAPMIRAVPHPLLENSPSDHVVRNMRGRNPRIPHLV
jgi:hypothetical protein